MSYTPNFSRPFKSHRGLRFDEWHTDFFDFLVERVSTVFFMSVDLTLPWSHIVLVSETPVTLVAQFQVETTND